MKPSILSFRAVIFVIILGIVLTGCLRPDISNIPAAPPVIPTNTVEALVPTIEPTIAATDLPVPTPTTAPGVPLLKYVPGGPFLMGSTDADKTARPDESPQHIVRLPGYWIYTYEVTNGMYAECVASGKCSTPELAETGPKSYFSQQKYIDYPVVGVNWAQAETYCKEHDARLPTEAEWEKASRGYMGKIYPWGDDQPSCELSNFLDCLKDTNKTAQYELGQSPYEVLDMAGNVREWVSDWYRQDYYALTPIYDPPGPEAGRLRVVRGGGYEDVGTDIRSASRFAYDPKKNFEDVGFRCVPLGVEHASYCQPSYQRSCEPPGKKERQPCTPGETTGGGITIRVSCPKDGQGDMTIKTGGKGPTATVTVDGTPWNCIPSSPGVYNCNGALPPAGSRVDVTICEGNLITGLPIQDLLMAASCKTIEYTVPSAPDSIAADGTLGSLFLTPTLPMSIHCPEGYHWDSNELTCVKTPDEIPQISEEGSNLCPQGYGFDPALGCCTPLKDSPCPPGQVPAEFTAALLATPNCVPLQPNGCEPGFIYDPYKGCIKPPAGVAVPDQGWCPTGSHWVDGKGCVTDPVPGVACPEGTYYSPLQQNCVKYGDHDCPENTYFNTSTKTCLPLRGPNSGCPPNQMMNPRLGCCEPIPGANETTCPEGTRQTANSVASITHVAGAYDPGTGNCPPEENQPCAQGWVMNAAGACEKISGCPEGTKPSTAAPGMCIPLDGSRKCPSGWEYNPLQKACQILGVQCADGSYFDLDLGYCIPLSENCCRLDQYIDPTTGRCTDIPTPDQNGRCPNGWMNLWGYCVQSGAPGDVICKTESIVIPACNITCPKGYDWNPKTGECEKTPSINPCSKYQDYRTCKAAGCTPVMAVGTTAVFLRCE